MYVRLSIKIVWFNLIIIVWMELNIFLKICYFLICINLKMKNYLELNEIIR